MAIITTYISSEKPITAIGKDFFATVDTDITVFGNDYNSFNNKASVKVTNLLEPNLSIINKNLPAYQSSYPIDISVNNTIERYAVLMDISSAIVGYGGAFTYLEDEYYFPRVFVSDTETDIIWTNLVGCTFSGVTLTCTAATGTAGAFSTASIFGNGGVSFVPPRDEMDGNYLVFFGLSSTDIDSSSNTINYGILLWSNYYIMVYENGIEIDTVGSYNRLDGDTISIERIGTTIYYKKNSTVLYTSTVPSTGLLYADVTFTSNAIGKSVTDMHLFVSDTDIATVASPIEITQVTVKNTLRYCILTEGNEIGENVKLFIYNQEGLANNVIDLDNSGAIITNAASMATDEDENVWIITDETPSKLVRVWWDDTDFLWKNTSTSLEF